MKNSKKQLHLLIELAQTILQNRLQMNSSKQNNLKKAKVQLNKMVEMGNYNQGILTMLHNNQSYKIGQRIHQFFVKDTQKDIFQTQLSLQLQFSAIRKSNGQIYNRELWQFSVTYCQPTEELKGEIEQEKSIVGFISLVLSLLSCYSVLPVSEKKKPTEYLTDYSIKIGQKNSRNSTPKQYQNQTIRKLMIPLHNKIIFIQLGFCYNQNVIIEDLIKANTQKTIEFFQNFDDKEFDFVDQIPKIKKYSIDTATSQNKAVDSEINQLYDEDLDITILSISDNHMQSRTFYLSQQSVEESHLYEKEQQFQLLLDFEESADEKLLKQNQSLFNSLLMLENQYLHI